MGNFELDLTSYLFCKVIYVVSTILLYHMYGGWFADVWLGQGWYLWLTLLESPQIPPYTEFKKNCLQKGFPALTALSEFLRFDTAVKSSTIQHSTVQYSTVQYSTVEQSTVQ